MVPLDEFIQLEQSDREDLYPYIWAVNKKNQLVRILVSAELVASTENRLGFWRVLKGLAGLTRKIDPEEIANRVRSETAQKLAGGLMAMLQSEGGLPDVESLVAPPAAPEQEAAASAATAFEPAWIDQSECTSCDECVNINQKIFAYDDQKKAFLKDPKGGPFKDIVRAAEKCTGRCIHPGTPANQGEKGLDKLIKRAEKFQ
jgi:pyruvate-ferredoxin/flavodoxin oxidoreductase